MDVQEIERIGAEDAAEQGEHIPAGAIVPAGGGGLDLSEEFAEFLDMAANIAGVATGMPVAERFTHEANVKISQQAIKVCQRHGWDAQKLLIGQDSALGVWLGLGVAVAMPGAAVWHDWKTLQAHRAAAAAKQVEGERVTDGSENASSGQQSGQ